MASAALKVEDDRTFARTRVLLTGTLMTPDGVVQIRIRDISAAGAQILAERPLREGCDALFKRGPTFAAARVVWSNEQYAGLSFYRQVDHDLSQHAHPNAGRR